MVGARLRGERVARLRKAAGWTQTQLAVQLGASGRLRVGHWERGQEQPQPRYLPRLAGALQVEPLDLLAINRKDPPLLALRLAAGLTLAEVAADSGLAYSSYYRLEHGLVRADPAPEAADVLAQALGVTAEQVLNAAARSRAERQPRR